MQILTSANQITANLSVSSFKLSMLFLLCLLLSFMTPTQSAIIDVGVKCLGNKILIENVCV